MLLHCASCHYLFMSCYVLLCHDVMMSSNIDHTSSDHAINVCYSISDIVMIIEWR